MKNIRPFRAKWTLTNRSHFLLRVGYCLEKGFTLHEALALQQAEASPAARLTIEAMLDRLEKGDEIPLVFAQSGFPNDITCFLHFSNQTGTLSKGLIEAGTLLEAKIARKRKMEQLLRYPLFLFWLLSVMGFIIIKHILPSFNELYRSMSLSLPLLSRLLLTLGTHFAFFITTLLIVGLTCLALLLGLKRTLSPDKQMGILLCIPILSYLVKLSLTSTFTTHLGSLLKVGMPINQAFLVMAGQTFQPFLQAESTHISEKLTEGYSLPHILNARPFYTKDLATVVRNGSASHRLGIVLSDYSQLLFKTLEDRLLRYILFIQPFFFFLFGGFILTLFLSILLPMFHLIKGL
ncbi:MAG TPA: competence type IV pilus assembly protein ComGB [Candidatus Angelobacter sp.]|nr:competence type IV pilus assembly protein ComGB [Candidatus Angelobacter sp.]